MTMTNDLKDYLSLFNRKKLKQIYFTKGGTAVRRINANE